MFKKILGALMVALALAQPASAQLGLNYTTFSPGQTISSSQFTENFTNISNKALNRTGGTATGTVTFDSGAEFNGSFTIGSSNLQPFDSVGKIKGFNSTYFDDANVTEAQITDGAILARVGAAESINAAWNFTVTPTFSSGAVVLSGGVPQVQFYQSDVPADSRYWLMLVQGSDFALTAYDDALAGGVTALQFTRSGVSSIANATMTASAISLVGNVSVTGNFSISGSFTPTAVLASGGSVLAPAFSFSGDTDTGMFLLNANEIAFAVNGVSVHKITQSEITFGASIFPTATNTYKSGSSTVAWSEVWAYAYQSPSDIRLKRNINSLNLGIEFIDSLKPKEYYWKQGNVTTKQYGFIAQDLLRLGFEGVDTSNSEAYSLNYTQLIAPIVKGLQEVHAELHVLEAQNEILAAELIKLKQEVAALKRGGGVRMVE